MASAYKVEELLALRDSVSESAVSLDKFADEVVVKGKFCFHLSTLTSPLYASSFAARSCIVAPSPPSRVALILSLSFLLPYGKTTRLTPARTRPASLRLCAIDRSQI